jgi:hypothetical protein
MKTIIAGCRNFYDYDKFKKALELYKNPITEIVSGHASGADSLGEKYAKENNIPLKLFPANWELYGKSAGYKRNYQMALYADCLIAFWDWESKGTKMMIELIIKENKPKFIVRI